MCKTCAKSKKCKFLFLVSDKNTHDLATYIHFSICLFRAPHHPVLILEAAKKTCHLPRNICDNITTATEKVFRLKISYFYHTINYIFYLPSIEKFETLTIQKYKKCFLPTGPSNSNFDNSGPWKSSFHTWGPRKSDLGWGT